MTLWSWLLLGVGAIATIWWWGGRPVYYRHCLLKDCERLIHSFLSQLDKGAIWIAEREKGAGFLQFALVANKPLEQAVDFGLPDVNWSGDRFDAVIRSLDAAGFDCSVEVLNSGQIKRFLRVRCTGKRPQLSKMALDLLLRVAEGLGWAESESYTVHCRGPGPGPQAWRDLFDGLQRVPHDGVTRILRRYAKRQYEKRR